MIDLSVVIPVFNEEASLVELHGRLATALRSIERPALRHETIFVDDGSTDRSREVVRELAVRDATVRLHALLRNSGQTQAILEGLERSAGARVVTLDADLQNPPEEIPRVYEALAAGHDLVLTRRRERNDPAVRRLASRVSNKLSSWIAGMPVSDHGCMLCGFSGDLVRRMCARPGRLAFIQALAVRYAKSPIEIDVDHAPRAHGKSRYSMLSLFELQLRAAISFRAARRGRSSDER